jgi:hypothetical protein
MDWAEDRPLSAAASDHTKCFWISGTFLARPAACISHLCARLGHRSLEIDPQKLTPMGPPESNSHNRMKYPHTQSTT